MSYDVLQLTSLKELAIPPTHYAHCGLFTPCHKVPQYRLLQILRD